MIQSAAVDVWHCDAGGMYSGAVAGIKTAAGYTASVTMGVHA